MRNAEIHSQRQRPVARIAALALLLGGCATTKPPIVVAATAPAATSAPCVDPAHVPAEPPMVGSKFNGDARHDLQVLAPNAKALRDWGEQLRTLLQACAPKAAVPAKP